MVTVEDYRRACRATDDPDLARVLTEEADALSLREAELDAALARAEETWRKERADCARMVRDPESWLD